MRRRRFVTALATTGVAVSAGCIGVGAPRAESGTDGPDRPDEPIEPAVRIDTPPHPIDRPDVDDKPFDEREAKWEADYLGAAIDREPTVPFESVDIPHISQWDIGEIGHEDYRVEVFDTYEAVETALSDAGGNRQSRVFEELEEGMFSGGVIVEVLAGMGSGSVWPVWVRAEPVKDGIHLHGYLHQPLLQTDDLVIRSSVVHIDHPEDDPPAVVHVSLTRNADERVHVNSTEDLVTIE